MDATPGAAVDNGMLIPEIDFPAEGLRISTERYWCGEYAQRERERLWMRVWQIAAREDDLPAPGDWLVHTIFDQSYVLVRGRDGKVRGFVNACRHRGNAFCEGKGHSARFTCPYHNWSYGLDGKLLAVARPDFEGTLEEFVGEKEELGLVAISADCFGGFVFVNPDPQAEPLMDFLGEAAIMLAPYRMEEMVPVGMNVVEDIASNWKVVMDAFHEGYHVQGVHPQLTPYVDLTRERCSFFGAHSVTTVPFGGPGQAGLSDEQDIEVIRALPPENFPGLVETMPHFEALVAANSGADGKPAFPPGVSAQTLLQRATRVVMESKGFDVSGLTDKQLSDFQFWALFPNVFLQIRAGEATLIVGEPHPSGDPQRCRWRVTAFLWLPESARAAAREPVLHIGPGDHFPYFLALEQDFLQMEIQQRGLRNRAVSEMAVTRQEPKVAHFHAEVDRLIAG